MTGAGRQPKAHTHRHASGITSSLALHLCHEVDNTITPEERQTFTIVLGKEHPLHRFTGNKAGRKIRRMAAKSPYGNRLSRKENFLSDISCLDERKKRNMGLED